MTTLAARIAHATTAAFTTRADATAGAFADADVERRYTMLLRSGRAWAKNSRTVVASVRTSSVFDTAVWGYAASEALDAGSQDVALPDTACIEQIAPGLYELTW